MGKCKTTYVQKEGGGEKGRDLSDFISQFPFSFLHQKNKEVLVKGKRKGEEKGKHFLFHLENGRGTYYYKQKGERREAFGFWWKHPHSACNVEEEGGEGNNSLHLFREGEGKGGYSAFSRIRKIMKVGRGRGSK